MSHINPWRIYYERVLCELRSSKVLTFSQAQRRIINRKYAKKKHVQNQKLRTSLKRKFGGVCANCGESDLRLLEFAHFERGTKRFRSFGGILSTKGILEESKKGRFLCIWCHRLETKEEIDRDVRKSVEDYKHHVFLNEHDPHAKQCIGKLCDGRFVAKSDFYKKGAKCKKCHAYNMKLKAEEQGKIILEVKLKLKTCSKCGIQVTNESSCCFDFDHVNADEKITEVSSLPKTACLQSIMQEIEKCQLLCCKCHRLKTLNEQHCTDVNIY
jgi:hypothetical protein